MKSKFFLYFLASLIIILSGSSFIHYNYVENKFDQSVFSTLLSCYLINLIVTVLLFLIIGFVHRANSSITGYIFLTGTLLKFIIYFSLVKPILTQDGEVTKLKFFFFFVPYILSLIIEVFWLVRFMNQQDSNKG